MIFVIAGNNIETIISYYGCLKSNCVVALIDENLSEELLKRLIKRYKPNFILKVKKNILFKSYERKIIFNDYELLKKKRITRYL